MGIRNAANGLPFIGNKIDGILVDIASIRRAILADQLRVTDHADEEMAADNLVLDDVFASVQSGEIIEDYPSDHPLPSCLIFGPATDGNPVHSVRAYNAQTERAVLITVYRPDPDRWIEYRTRKAR